MRLADLSHPRISILTAGLSPEATALANRLAKRIGQLDQPSIEALHQVLDQTGGAERS